MLPNSGVTTTMVSNELGVSTRVISELCLNDKINMWAKYKPIRFDTISGLTEQLRQREHYGLVFPEDDDPEGVYTYAKPRGYQVGSSLYKEYFRIGDFRGYYHQAPPPFYTNFPDIIYTNQLAYFHCYFDNEAAIESPWNEGCISMRDLMYNGEYYVALICFNLTRGFIKFVTSNSTLNLILDDVGNKQLTFDSSMFLSIFSGGDTCKFVFALSSYKDTDGTNPDGYNASWFSSLELLPDLSKRTYDIITDRGPELKYVSGTWSFEDQFDYSQLVINGGKFTVRNEGSSHIFSFMAEVRIEYIDHVTGEYAESSQDLGSMNYDIAKGDYTFSLNPKWFPVYADYEDKSDHFICTMIVSYKLYNQPSYPIRTLYAYSWDYGDWH